jgi:hypothetical protein
MRGEKGESLKRSKSMTKEKEKRDIEKKEKARRKREKRGKAGGERAKREKARLSEQKNLDKEFRVF